MKRLLRAHRHTLGVAARDARLGDDVGHARLLRFIGLEARGVEEDVGLAVDGEDGATGSTGPTGSVGLVAGATTQVVFNDAGAAAGDSGLTYAKSTDVLTVVGSVQGGNL